jgi:cytochrome b6
MNVERYYFFLRRLATLISISILTLAWFEIGTGLLLAFYYEPAAGTAYNSLEHINNVIANGSLFRSIHHIAGHGIIILALVQIVVMFLGRQFRTSWLTAWISGILLTLSTIALAWTAMILGWQQKGFWRLRIELQTIEAIPLIGNRLVDIITGGGGIDSTTVIHLYTIHSYVLSVVAILLSSTHLAGLLLQEYEQKHALQVASNNFISGNKNVEDKALQKRIFVERS